MPSAAFVILAEVAKRYDVPLQRLLGTSDKHRLAPARGEAMHRLMQHVMPCGRPFSSRQVAAWFGCEHSNVVRKAQAWGEAA
jgi:chromosomal replication initiation ATPase DnaA